MSSPSPTEKCDSIREKVPRCILLEGVKQDISDAEDFGEIVYLFDHGESRPSLFSEEFLTRLSERFEEIHFDPLVDYFVLTGYQLSLVAAVHVLTIDYGRFNTLAFHAPTHGYCELQMRYGPIK